MPRKKNVMTRYRPYRRKRRQRNTRNYAHLSVRSAFPRSVMVKLRYSQTISLNPGIGTASNYVFKANDTYDPDTTGVGGQPKGRDQWVTFYNHQTVYGSKITAHFSNQNNEPIVGGITLKDDAVTDSNIDSLKEDSESVWKYIAGKSGGPTEKNVSKTFSCRKFFNVKNPKDSTDLSAPVTTSPSELAQYHIWVAAQDETTDVGTVYINVIIEYIVLFSEPKDLGRS